MNVNTKGVSGLIKVIDKLQEKGYYTFTAFDDHSPVDLIALSDTGKTFKLQVKYRTKNSRKDVERYELQASSVVNGKRIPIDKSMIDGWAVYLADCKKIVFIKVGLLENKNFFSIDPDGDYGELAEW